MLWLLSTFMVVPKWMKIKKISPKWKARVMPSFLKYVEDKHCLPSCIVASFAFYLAFYNGDVLTDAGLIGKRNGIEYTIMDDRNVLEFFYAHRQDSTEELVQAVMSNLDFWGQDLTQISQFKSTVVEYLNEIKTNGAYSLMQKLI